MTGQTRLQQMERRHDSDDTRNATGPRTSRSSTPRTWRIRSRSGRTSARLVRSLIRTGGEATGCPTRYSDVTAIAHDIEHFSSLKVAVIPFQGEEPPPDQRILEHGLPPISADPPLHTWTRRLLLPWFSHNRVASYEAFTRDLCSSLIDKFISTGHADAAEHYSQQIPVRVIAKILGVSEDLSDTFTGWVRDVLEFADDAGAPRTRGTWARRLFRRGDRAPARPSLATTS